MNQNINQQRYEYLASKWKSKQITSAEELELFNWLNSDEEIEITIPSSFAASEASLKRTLFEEINKEIQRNLEINRNREINKEFKTNEKIGRNKEIISDRQREVQGANQEGTNPLGVWKKN